MKKMYRLEIRKVGTHEYRKRDILLTEKEANELKNKFRKNENGFVLVNFGEVYSNK